jgi:DNA helicase IV
MVLVPRPRDARVRAEVALDPKQRAAVELAPDRSLLVLGEAGYGKTTVAIHRLAHLFHAARGPFRAAVIVPSEGLARMIQPMLVRLGVDVNVQTYDRWARRQARRAFADVPRRESKDASAAVVRVKRERALAVAIAEIAGRDPGVRDDDRDAKRVRSKA